MEVHGHLFGGAPILRKVQIGEALTLAGLPMIASVLADVDGTKRASTTAAAEALGISLDAQPTRNTAQLTTNGDPAVYVTVNVRPDQIVKARLSGSATANTALTETANTSASTTGLVITTTANQSAYDDGYAWGAAGANAGILRKITAVTTTSTTIIPFPADIAVGDTFYFATFGPLEDAGVQLTSDLSQVDASGDNQSGTNFRCHAFYQRAKADGGANTSFALLVFSDHLFAQ